MSGLSLLVIPIPNPKGILYLYCYNRSPFAVKEGLQGGEELSIPPPHFRHEQRVVCPNTRGGGTFLLVLPYIRDVKSLGTIPNLVNSTDVNTDVYIYTA